MAGNDLTIANSGMISGGNGGSSSGPRGGGGGGGGGHGVIGSHLTISNSGTISGGASGAPALVVGTAGDAILFTGGVSTLSLLTGSTISGNLEVASGANVSIQPQNSGLTLSNNIVLDDNTTYVRFDTTPASMTVSGVISGGGGLVVSGPGTGLSKTILTGANTFTGGSTILSGDLQVDGSIGDATVNGGFLGGVGSVGNITLNVSGVIAPGDSPGTLKATSLTWNGGGAFNFQLGATNSATDCWHSLAR